MKYSPRAILAAAAVVLVLVIPVSSGCKELQVLASQDVTVYYEDSLEASALEIEASFRDLVRELEAVLGWRLPESPAVVLTADRRTFVRMAGSDHVAAVAIPRKQLILIDHSRMTLRSSTLKHTLKHELCHLLLHRHIDSPRLPRWLDEGVAQWTSDGMSEILMKRNPFLVSRAVRTGNIIPLRHMETSFPASEQELLLSYEASKSIVEFILRDYGREGLQGILEGLRRGDDIDGAVPGSLGISLDELERRWHDHVRGRASWIAFAGYYLYELLFVGAALLLVAAFIRTMKRKRDFRRFDEGDDTGQEK
ncbi:MAG: peptidase MA family metallohydrolase [Syntrophales bacterium]|nr:peptidase MA family metallohydrolase [Syntrophales bacterium]MCK9527125.1 peptidase MA family metallohydrolase [Syntrophales bacterium]MDX9921750.1 peptidase MA family metallohydrolase [Syntrophales bacterium]